MTDNENSLTHCFPALHHAPTLFTPTPKASRRVLEFFTAHINNAHTRKAYLNATGRFAAEVGAIILDMYTGLPQTHEIWPTRVSLRTHSYCTSQNPRWDVHPK